MSAIIEEPASDEEAPSSPVAAAPSAVVGSEARRGTMISKDMMASGMAEAEWRDLEQVMAKQAAAAVEPKAEAAATPPAAKGGGFAQIFSRMLSGLVSGDKDKHKGEMSLAPVAAAASSDTPPAAAAADAESLASKSEFSPEECVARSAQALAAQRYDTRPLASIPVSCFKFHESFLF